jgi:hypothetical protein
LKKKIVLGKIALLYRWIMLWNVSIAFSLWISCYVFFQVIRLSASANKLSKLKEQADEYASLIMEELDVDQLGYIEVRFPVSSPSPPPNISL